MSDQSNIQEQQHVAFGLPQDNPKQMKHVPDNFDNRSKTKSAGALWLFFKSTMSPPRKKLRRRENGTCIGMYVRIKVFRGGMGVNIFKFEISCNPLYDVLAVFSSVPMYVPAPFLYTPLLQTQA